jgi:hypothetical protein
MPKNIRPYRLYSDPLLVERYRELLRACVVQRLRESTGLVVPYALLAFVEHELKERKLWPIDE